MNRRTEIGSNKVCFGQLFSALGFCFLHGAVAYAESYSFEAGGTYGRSQSETSSPVFGSNELFRTDTDTDSLGIGFTWFPEALDISGQLRPEAAFLTRTTSLSLSYSRNSTDTAASGAFGLNFSDSFSSDSVNASGRYIWENSGWFVDGALGRADVEGQTSTSVTAGFGRYVATNTTLGLTLGRSEAEFDGVTSSSTGAILTGKHIGSFRGPWQYGIDASVSSIAAGDADGSYSASFSLFPNQDVELGFGLAGPLGSRGNDTMSYGLRGSWFVRPVLQIRGSFSWTSFDNDGDIDQDADGLSLGVLYRF